MNKFLVFAAEMDSVWTRIALSLVHSLWVGAAIGAIALILFFLLRSNRYHAARYNMLVLSLFSIAVSPALVFIELAPTTIAPQIVNQPSEVVFNDSMIDTAAEIPAEPVENVAQTEPSGIIPADMQVAGPDLSPATTAPEMGTSMIATSHNIAKIAVALYGAIAIALLTRLFLGIAGGTWLRRRSELVTDGMILGAAAKNAAALGLRFSPAIAYCSRVAVPTVVGVIRPIILLPLSCATGMTPEQVEYLVLHELAHIRRYDHIVNLVQRVIEALMFYHPIVWLISRQIRIEREQCCDDLVVRFRGNAQQYAESLLAAATFASNARKTLLVAPAALSATGKASHLRVRIARILGEPAPAVRIRHGGWIASVALLLCVVGGTQLFASNQESGLLPQVAPPQMIAAGVADSYDQTDSGEPDTSGIDAERMLPELQSSLGDLRGVQITGISFIEGAGDERQIVIEISVSADTKMENYVLLLDKIEKRATEMVHERYGKGAKLGDGKYLADDPISISITSMPESGEYTAAKNTSEFMKNDMTERLLPELQSSLDDLRGVQITGVSFIEGAGDERQIVIEISVSADTKMENYVLLLDKIEKRATELVHERYGKNAALADGKHLADDPISISLTSMPTSTDTTHSEPSMYSDVGTLDRQLLDKDWWLRKVAIQQLADSGAKDIYQSLIPMLKDEDERVQVAAAIALGQLKAPESIPHLVAALKESRETSEAAAKALAQFEPSQVMPLIRMAAEDEDGGVQRGAIKAMREVKSPETIDLLIKLLGDIPKGKVQQSPITRPSARSRGRVSDPMSFVDRDALSAELAGAIFELVESASFSQLISRAMGHDNWRARAGIMKVLADPLLESEGSTSLVREVLNHKAVLSGQINAMKDEQKDVRAWAAVGLGNAFQKLTDDPAATAMRRSALIAGLRDSNLQIAGICGAFLAGERSVQLENEDDAIALMIARKDIEGLVTKRGRAIPALSAAIQRDFSAPLSEDSQPSNASEFLADTLARIGGPQTVQPLIDLLAVANDDAMAIAATALGNTKDPRAIEPLLQMVHSSDSGMQYAALKSLGQLKDPRGFEPLSAALNSPNDEMRTIAVRGLGNLGDPRAVQLLSDLVAEGQDSRVLPEAIEALGKLGDKAAVPSLVALLTKKDVEPERGQNIGDIRAATAIALGNLGATDAVDALISTLRTDSRENVRQESAVALGKLKDPKAIDVLVDAVQFDESSRQMAANALVAIDTPESIRALYAVYPANPRVGGGDTYAIVSALISSEHPAARDALFELLRDNRIPEGKIQLDAALALAKQDDPRATEFLNKLRGNPDTRIESERALSEIESLPSRTEGNVSDTVKSEVSNTRSGAEPQAVPLIE